MPPLPSFVLGCQPTLALLMRALAGEYAWTSYHDAYDQFLAAEGGYAPSPEVEEWMRLNWATLMSPTIAVGSQAIAPAELPRVPILADLAVQRAPVLAEEWMQPFLDEYIANGGVVIQAAKAGPISRETVRLYLRDDPEFARAFVLAEEERKGIIRSTIKRRAIDGWDEPVFGRVGKDQDGIVGHIRKHDNRLLMRLAESCLEEFAKSTEGTTVTVNTNATANASAAAVVLSAPAKLKSLKDRKRRQNEKAALRASVAKN